MSVPALTSPPEPDQWAVVELLGHVSYGCRLSSQSIAGATLIRLDIPADVSETLVAKFVGSGAVYAITVCDEAYARQYQRRYGQSPLKNLPAEPAPNAPRLGVTVPEYDEDDDYFGDCDPWDSEDDDDWPA